jgi:hypothetical protein
MSETRKALAELAEAANSYLITRTTRERAKLEGALIAARAALAQPEPEPVGWFESPHGAFRANPDYRLEFPSQLLQWSVPVYLSSAAPSPPAQPEFELFFQADGTSFIDGLLAEQPALSDERIEELVRRVTGIKGGRSLIGEQVIEFARAIERALRGTL